MNLQSIIITNCMGCAILIILLISSYFVRQRRKTEDRIFTAMIVLTISSCLGEMISYIIDGTSFAVTRPLALLINTWLFIANLSVSLLWSVYTDLKLYRSPERIKRLYRYIAIPAIFAVILLIFNLPFRFVFSIDEQNFYHRELIGYCYYFPTLGYLIYSIINRHIFYKKNGKNEFFPIWMFLTPVFIGATVQVVVYGISVAWSAVALGLVGIYMSLQNELSYLDPLTKLYNRNYLNQTLHDMELHNQAVGGLMIDIDFFKTINDRFGHSAGDQALMDASAILQHAAPKNAILVRFAGDEFVVLLRCREIKEVEEIESAIRNELETFNSAGERPYQLSMSIGAAVHTLGKDTADMFLNDIDNRMYEQKKANHCQR